MLKQQTIKSKSNSDNPYVGREGLVYVRVSSKRQEVEGHGRESQESRCKQELSALGVTYRKTFPDTYSGGGDFMKRPAMKELISFVDAHPYKKFVVIFDDLKRFARDTEFHLKLRTALKVRDVLPQCLNYKFDDSPEGMFVETVLAAGNELERHQNRRQVVQKMKARLEAGYWAFGVKRGYRMLKDPIHGKLAVHNGKEAKAIKYALEGFSTAIFVRRIDACKYLIEKGFWKGKYPEKYTDEFTAMLKDCFYLGDIEYQPWEVSRRKGHHEALISEDTFEKNLRRLKNEMSGKKIRKDMSEDFMLRGLIVCVHCTGHLTGASTTKSKGANKKYPYYFCQNRKCPLYRKSLSRDEVEKKFAMLLKEQKMKRNVNVLVKNVFDRVWKQEISSMVDRDLSLKQEQAVLEEKSKKLTDLIISSTDDQLIQAYKSQLKQTLTEIDALSGQFTEGIDYSVPYRTALNKSIGLLSNPYSVWEKLPLVEKQKLFYFIFMEKLPYDKNEGYRTTEVPSAVRLFEEFATSKPDYVDYIRVNWNQILEGLQQWQGVLQPNYAFV